MEVTVEARPEGSQAATDSRRAAVWIAGPMRLLVVAPPIVAEALAAAIGAEAAPAGPPASIAHDVVLLADVGGDRARSWAPAIARHCAAGGGLVLAGARQAFGPGGWAGTDLEVLSPLGFDPSRRGGDPIALALVIDGSGSMGRPHPAEPGLTRYEAAIRALFPVPDLAPADTVRALVFDRAVKARLGPASGGDPWALRATLLAVSPGGGTDPFPALLAALADLASDPASKRHVVLVSDGEVKAQPDRLAALRSARTEAGATVAVVSVGGRGEALAAIAEAGGGRLYTPPEVSAALSEAIGREVRTVAGEAVIEGPVSVVRQGDMPLPPDVPCAARTTAKPGAEVDASLATGEPVLARWRAGLGRVVAIATPPAGPWSAVALEAARWAAPPEADPGWTIRAERRGALVRVEARGANGSVGGLAPDLVLGETRAPMDQVGVRTYTAEAAAPAVPFGLAVEVAGRTVARAVVDAGPAEESYAQPDLAALARIALAGDGDVLTSGSALPPPPPARDRRDLAPLLAMAAILLLLADAAWRAVRSSGLTDPTSRADSSNP